MKFALFNLKNKKNLMVRGKQNVVFLFYPFFFLSHIVMEVGRQFVISESQILQIKLFKKI